MDAKVTALIERYGITERARAFLAGDKKMYIDGEWCDAADGATFDIIEPSTEGHLATVPHGSVGDLDRAVAAANRALREGPS